MLACQPLSGIRVGHRCKAARRFAELQRRAPIRAPWARKRAKYYLRYYYRAVTSPPWPAARSRRADGPLSTRIIIAAACKRVTGSPIRVTAAADRSESTSIFRGKGYIIIECWFRFGSLVVPGAAGAGRAVGRVALTRTVELTVGGSAELS